MKNIIFGGLFLVLTGGIILVSCKKNINDESPEQFDFAMFENRSSLFDFFNVNKINFSDNRNYTIEDFESVLESLNEEYNTNLFVTQFDLYLIDNPDATIDEMLEHGYLTNQQYLMINSFFEDLDFYTFDEALERLRVQALRSDFSAELKEQYVFFVNTLMIMEDYYSTRGIDIFNVSDNKASTASQTAGCAVAIASNAVATVSLNSCFVPGPWCWVAVAGKALSLAGMYFSC